MPVVFPAMNTIWFWFDKKTRRMLHGTPDDCMRKYEVFKEKNIPLAGFEIFLMPSQLKNIDQFSPAFYRAFSRLNCRTVHIGESKPDFLITDPAVSDQLSLLAQVLQRLETDTLILHAHHLKKGRPKIRRLFSETLPGVDICIENNGFDDEWGYSLEGLRSIFSDCPELKFCLDLAHVKDFNNGNCLDDFLTEELLASRLKEIHFSYSTILLDSEPYAARGYPGYNPYHALFAVLGLSPSQRTRDFIKRYPIVVEGVVPKQDTQLNFVKQEMSLLD